MSDNFPDTLELSLRKRLGEKTQRIAELERELAEANEEESRANAQMARIARSLGMEVWSYDEVADGAISERDRLRKALEEAPHSAQCATFHDLRWTCNCWKTAVLASEEKGYQP